jgi:hypothetical protein
MLLFLAIIGGLLTFGSIITEAQFKNNMPFTSAIWTDYLYRVLVVIIILAAVFFLIVEVSLILWEPTQIPLRAKYFGSAFPRKAQIDESWGLSFEKILTKKRYLTIIVCFLLFPLIALLFRGFPTQMITDATTFLTIWLIGLIVGIYVAYVVVLSYGETTKYISVSWSREVKLHKASMGSGILLMVLILFILRATVHLMQVIWKQLLDNGVLASHLSYTPFTSAHVTILSDFVTSLVAYLVPMVATIFYYFFTIFAKRHFSSPVWAKAQKELILDTMFFAATFSGGLWLQSLVVPIDYDRIVISLTASFLLNSFKNYLEALR